MPNDRVYTTGGGGRKATLTILAMIPVERHYPEAKYGGFSRVDGTVAFYARVQALLPERGTVLDVGCGRGRYADDTSRYRRDLRVLRGGQRTVVGIDMDPDAVVNPYLDEFRHIQANSWPMRNKSVDLVLCDFVLEHVEEPRNFFSEVARVLKPGGVFCARTTNAIGYVGILGRLVPNRLHSRVLRGTLQSKRETQDVFETRYRCNTRWQLENLLSATGFNSAVVWGHASEPSYLQSSSWLYYIGKIYHRVVPNILAPTLFIFARLDGDGGMSEEASSRPDLSRI